MDILSVNALSGYTQPTDTAKTTASGSDIDFARLISDALKSEYSEKAITMTSSVSGNSSDMSGMSAMSGLSGSSGGVEQMILAAAASGQTDDTQMAIMMLLMMLQSESTSGEASQLYGMMSALISQMDTKAQKKVYTDTMDSGAEPAVLIDLENGIFGGMGLAAAHQGASAYVPTQAWKAAVPVLRGSEDSRSPQALRDIIGQFDVENAERYRPFRNGSTYCNIFLWDVTSALGCEIPHYIDKATGEPRTYPDVDGAWEMNANATCDWLANSGERYGWREVSAAEAQQWANAGRPAVTAWKNAADKPGHVQVVCPSQDGGYDPVRGVTVAQAGARVTEYDYISSTFKQSDLKNVRYYIHD